MPLVPDDPGPPSADSADRFPDSPPEFAPAARAAFRQLARDCGNTIYRMPSSCEMYLRQYLAGFDAERAALVDGLRRDVPNRIQQYDGRADGYEDYLLGLADSYGHEAGVGREVAWWVVTGWATATGRPIGSPLPPPVGRPVGVPPPTRGPDETTLRLAMTGIAAAGGFLGGLVGIAVPFLLIFLLKLGAEERDVKAVEALGMAMIVVMCSAAALAGAGGAATGWHLGRGTEAPWAGFAGAFVATLSTGAVVGFCCGPLNPITWGIMFTTGFGATFTTSARGGWG